MLLLFCALCCYAGDVCGVKCLCLLVRVSCFVCCFFVLVLVFAIVCVLLSFSLCAVLFACVVFRDVLSYAVMMCVVFLMFHCCLRCGLVVLCVLYGY